MIDFKNAPAVKAMLDAQASIKKQQEAFGQKGFHEAAMLLLNAHPTVESIRWEQYSPYFNDGEPCTFGIRSVYVKFIGVEDGGDNDDGLMSTYDDLPDDVNTSLESFDKFLNDMEDVAHTAFGDHQQVTIDREGVTLEDCDHD